MALVVLAVMHVHTLTEWAPSDCGCVSQTDLVEVLLLYGGVCASSQLQLCSFC